MNRERPPARKHEAPRFLALVILLGAIAAAAQPPRSSDRDVYERIGRAGIVLDCGDLHCFRPLVPFVLEHLPGPGLVRWKAYAVVAAAAAALAVARLCLVLGLPARAARLAMWIAAFGYGPLQSIFDPYTSDPLMYLLGPLILADLLAGAFLRGSLLAGVGVFAKEFAAVPVGIFALYSAIERRWETALRVAVAAFGVVLVWLTLQTALMTLFNYRYIGHPSVKPLGGGYFKVWLDTLGPREALAHFFLGLGPLWVLLATGLVRADRKRRLLALCALPPAAAFLYVQQPDRALWNFHFIVIPIAVTMLAEMSDRVCAVFIAAFAIANVRLGEPQPAFFPVLRAAALAASTSIAVAASVKGLGQR